MEAASGGQKGKKSAAAAASAAADGQGKPKRQMKTPFQLEILEKAYAYDAYPPEDVRAELSKKLGLSDRQLQMWFCHRRLKSKREEAAKKQRVPSPADETTRVSGRGPEPASVSGSDSGSGPVSGPGYGSGSSSSFSQREAWKGGTRRVGVRPVAVEDGTPMRRAYREIVPLPLSMLEHRAIALVEGQLGEPLREDGPILGIDFDPLPPDAFGAAIAAISEQCRQPELPNKYKIHEGHDSRLDKVRKRSRSDYKKYQYLQRHPNIHRSDADEGVSLPHFDMSLDDSRFRSPYVQGNDLFRRRGVHGNTSHDDLPSEQEKQEGVHAESPSCYNSVLVPHLTTATNDELGAASLVVGSENLNVSCDMMTPLNPEMLLMKRKNKIDGDKKMSRESDFYGKKIRKELEKQDTLRRKREEQMKREMEKHERERRKEEEKLMREKQREEERFQREQKREFARREKFMRRESMRAEKMRQKEELRKEKEEARRKAASERATARRIARESMGLIDDEKLELMELGGASSKGGTSIYSTEDSATQNPGSFSDILGEFPSKSVKLKLPFSVKPWNNAEENIGKLLMVWRFLITFADVLELWPFTLDEFVQAFHDCESRLLSEVHVCLLKLLIRDIEDFVRAPSTGGINQYSTGSLEGGHPMIVQGAYAWGFNICSWKQHINALTWPEILRQFALSAGFGPQLKKKCIEPTYLHDNNEGKDCEDIICTLRNGSAAEIAASVMHRKGFPLVRRSRHRLTPGTVKFAAFHVLSLEGSRGLTILELAEKIQKSGLRDLTMSKAPEASIAAALSRDAKLFERTAPSTYCVRSPYRKDPTDAELILSSANEKLQVFENGFLAGEDADVLEKGDSESDAAEGSEVDDVSTPLNDDKMVVHHTEVGACSGNGKENFPCDAFSKMENGFDNSGKESSLLLGDYKDVDGTKLVTNEGICGISPDLESMEIDESKPHEPWVEGLAEGEYSALSVEDRLDALVALVSVVNEGKSIRAILEDRLEAANALKKQLWAEAQLDKRRVKEESTTKLQHPSFTGNNAETKLTNPVIDCCQSLSPLDGNYDDTSCKAAEKQESVIGSHGVNSLLSDRTSIDQSSSLVIDNFMYQHNKYAAERSQAQLKSYVGYKAEEIYAYRSLPLGQDRRRNRYWQFVASASRNDPGGGRIFIELHDGRWRLIDSEEAFDALLISLDTRGVREYHLHSMLLKIETAFKENVRKFSQCTKTLGQCAVIVKSEVSEIGSSPNITAALNSSVSMVSDSNSNMSETLSFKIQLGKNLAEKVAVLERYQDFQRLVRQECFHSLTLCAEKYGKNRGTQLLSICELCLDSFDSEDQLGFSEHVNQCERKRDSDTSNFSVSESSLPLQIRLLKYLLAFLEVSIPFPAFKSFWENYRKSWGLKLLSSSSAEDLLQVLTLLEGAIKKDYLSSNFETTKELLSSNTSEGNLTENSATVVTTPVLPWIPHTTAAVGLRLSELDLSISYEQHQKVELDEGEDVGQSIKHPSSFKAVQNFEEVATTGGNQSKFSEGNYCYVPVGSQKSSGYRQGGRGRGRGQAQNLRLQTRGGRPNAECSDGVNQGVPQRGQKRCAQVSGWGCRVVRRKRTGSRSEVASPDQQLEDEVGPSSSSRMMPMEDDFSSSSANSGEEDSDDSAPVAGYEVGNWRLSAAGRASNLMENPSDNDTGSPDGSDDGDEDEGDDDSIESIDASEGIDGAVGVQDGNDYEVSESAGSESLGTSSE